MRPRFPQVPVGRIADPRHAADDHEINVMIPQPVQDVEEVAGHVEAVR